MKSKTKNGRYRSLILPPLIVLVLGGMCLAALVVYQLPPVHDRLAWRVESLQAKIQRAINPPEELVFVPQGGSVAPESTPDPVEQAVAATMTAMAPAGANATPTVGVTEMSAPPATMTVDPVIDGTKHTQQPADFEPLPMATGTAVPSATATTAPTPLPPSALLGGVIHEYQEFNNCGPANMAMALSFWGWQGNQRDTRAFLRPNLKVDDKNVMPAEMVAYVQGQTQLRALARVGGDVELMRRLIAAGFPVLIEAGHDPSDDWWMGHYLTVNGYDDSTQMFTVQDSLLNPDLRMSYAELGEGYWRDFNYVYILVYAPEREAELLALLGERADETASYRLAEKRALEESQALTGREQFFALFNLGSSRVGLKDYTGAAQAYDQAFAIYSRLSEDMRPYRLMWYQVGPYEAYYNTGRYEDVIELANTTFGWVGKQVLEESFYWRGMAYLATGQTNHALYDLQKAAELNPYYTPPRDELAKMGQATP